MTVNTNLSRVQYNGNGVTTQFTFASRVLDASHLTVKTKVIATGVETTLVLNTDYQVTGVGGASCTVDTALLGAIPTGTQITIKRNVPLTQTADYVENDPFPAETHENALDKLTMIEQQQDETISRAFRFSDTAATNLVPEFTEAPVANRMPIFTDNFGRMENGPNAADIQNAQSYAAQTAADVITTGNNVTAAQAAQAAAEAAAAGIKWRPSVRASTTGALPAVTYANGTGGVGATLTANANGAIAAQDGVTLNLNDRLLVQNQAAQLQNGVYVLTQVGTAGTPFILTRATDADSWLELVSQTVIVEEGTTLADQAFICTVNQGGTIGTTAVTWATLNPPLADGAVSTAAKIVDGIITYVKLASSAIATLADVVAGTADKLIPASVGQQMLGWVLLDTKVASGSAQIDFTQFIDSTYDEYVIEFMDVAPSAATAGLFMRTSSNSGSSFDSGAGNYRWAANMNDSSAGADIDVSTGDTTIALLGAVLQRNTAGESAGGSVKLFRPSGTTFQKLIEVNNSSYDSVGNIRRNAGFGARTATAVINAVRFYYSTGNIATGTFRLYGIKK